MTDPKLLDCPFCGSHAVLIFNVSRRTFDTYTPICSNMQCKAQMPEYADEFSAITSWNARFPRIDCRKAGIGHGFDTRTGICIDCGYNRNIEKLIAFVKDVAKYSCELYPCRATFAKDLLKELGFENE